MMNIMNPPADWSTLKKLIWLRGTPTTGGEELTVSGTPPLSLPNSLGKPLKAWNVALSPYQDLHGYDSPWPAGGGKNKLNPDYSAYKTSPSYLFCDNVVPGGTAVMSFTDKDTSVNISGMYIGFCKGLTEEGGTLPAYRWAIKNGVVQSNTTNVASDGDVGALCDQVFIYPKTQATFDALFARYDIQAELGSTATSYAPYANICPIHGTDKLNVFVEESYDPAATPKVVITFDNTLYGGTYDAVTGVGTIDRASVELGTLNWSASTYGSVQFFYLDYPQIAKGTNNILCESLKPVESSTDNAFTQLGEDCIINTYLNGNGLRIRYDAANGSVSAFKTAMSGVELVYELATPIPFVTDGHTITTPKGHVYTWATAEDGTVDSMEVTYVGKA